MLAVVVVSKTFTTAETMLNARTLREWISAALGLVTLSTISLLRLFWHLYFIQTSHGISFADKFERLT